MLDISEDGEGGMSKSNHTNGKQINNSIIKNSPIKEDPNISLMSPIRKLSIDKDIDSIIT